MNALPAAITGAAFEPQPVGPLAPSARTTDDNLAALFAAVLRAADGSALDVVSRIADVEEPVTMPVRGTSDGAVPSLPGFAVPTDKDGEVPLPTGEETVVAFWEESAAWLDEGSGAEPRIPNLQAGRAPAGPLRIINLQLDRGGFEQFRQASSPKDLVIPIDLDISDTPYLNAHLVDPAPAGELPRIPQFIEPRALPLIFEVPTPSTPPAGTKGPIPALPQAVLEGHPDRPPAESVRRGNPGTAVRLAKAFTDHTRTPRVTEHARVTELPRAPGMTETRTFIRNAPVAIALTQTELPGTPLAGTATAIVVQAAPVGLRRAVAPLDFGRARQEQNFQWEDDANDRAVPPGPVREGEVVLPPPAATPVPPVDVFGASAPSDVVAERLANSSQVTFTVQDWQPGRPVQQIRIALDPAELGHIQIHFRQRGDKIFARIIASRQEALPLIRANLDTLRSALAERGIQFGGFSLTAASALTAAGIPAEGLSFGQGSGRKFSLDAESQDDVDISEQEGALA